MVRKLSACLRYGRFALFLYLLCFVSALLFAQSRTGLQVAGPVDDRVRVTLSGNVHPLAQSRHDRGEVAGSFPAERMFLLLRRSPDRQAALLQFLQDAHAPGSPAYHRWLTPEQFGELYGPDDSDVAAVSTWLETHGFSVTRVTKGKTAIEFSGTAAQIRDAFKTEIHTYVVDGEEHHANDRDPQVPAALAAIIAGVTPLNDFRPKHFAKLLGEVSYDLRAHAAKPQWTINNAPALALAPGDFAIQYNLNPLYQAAVDGRGVTIGIIGASNVDPTVVATYRSFFGLPPSPLNVIIDGTDPGQNGALVESYLDVEVAGAVAPGATINLYTAAGTLVQHGLNLAAQRAVDDNQATVLSTSYGLCEQGLGAAGNQFWAGLWEQAAAQGQTSLIASGDGGSAGCDNFNYSEPANLGLAVNGLSSTPWNISVGGTDFFYTSYNGSSAAKSAELASYWNLTPSLTTTSLLGPVPEQPWNRAFGLNLSNNGIYDPNAPSIVGGSGGASSCSSGISASDGPYSSCAGGYPKPSWQSASGVPSDGARDVPDISLFAASGENDSFYPICAFSWNCVITDGRVIVAGVGGTSASTPAMAGIMGLVNQKFGAQGQANYSLYALAAQYPAVFHDITKGSNNVPCTSGSPDCTLSTVNDNTNGFYTLAKFYATTGYDQATGLGSVDANLLLQYWNSLFFKPTKTTLTLSETTFSHGTPVAVSVAVTGDSGTPSGDVSLLTTAPGSAGGLHVFTLQGGAASAMLNDLPGGQYKVSARYSGDSVFATSTSDAVTVDVTAEDSILSLTGSYYSYADISFFPVSSGASYPYGTYLVIDAQPHGVSATQGAADSKATGTITFGDAISGGTSRSVTLNINSNGLAEWIPSTGFAAGAHSLSAAYSGDNSFHPSSTSTPLNFTITKSVPSVNLSASASRIALGSNVTLKLTVGIGPLAAPPTGSATFYLGDNVLGTASLAPLWRSVSTATLTVNTLPLGTNSITASYSGDDNLQPATSAAINVIVLQPPNLTTTASAPSINLAQSVTITVTASGVSGLPTPTGVVAFYGSSGFKTSSCVASLVNGSAPCKFDGTWFDPGYATIRVSYGGDSIYAPATVTVAIKITFPFTLSATPVVIATPGATTGNTSTITITPVDGFTGNVYFSCSLTSSPPGASYPPTCLISSVIAVTNSGAATTTMTISTTSFTSLAAVQPLHKGHLWAAFNGAMFAAAMCLFGIPGRWRIRRRIATCLICIAVVGTQVACGGGGRNGKPVIRRTTPGNYTFAVSGSFGVNFWPEQTQKVSVSVAVQ